METLIWLIPLAVLVAGTWRPQGGLLVLAASLPLFGSPPGGPYLAALDLAAIAAIATAWRSGPAPPTPLGRPVLAFVAVSAASLLPLAFLPPSWHPRVLASLLQVFPGVQAWSALYTWRAMANLLLGVGLYLAVRRAFAGRSWRPLGLALAAGLAAVLILGLAEKVGLVDLGGYRAIGGPVWRTRLHSLFFHSGWLAEFVVLAAPPALAALLLGRRWSRLCGALLAALAALVLLLTEQRGAWVAAAVQLLAAAALVGPELLRDRRQRLRLGGVLLAALLLAGIAAVLRPDVFEGVSRRAEMGVGDLSRRTRVWAASSEMIGERPALGWGLGAFSPALRESEAESIRNPLAWQTTHNHFLMLAAERGLLGAAAFALVCIALLLHLLGSLRAGGETRSLAVGLTLGFVGFLVYGLAQYIFFIKMLEWLFWILLASASLAPATTARESGRTHRLLRGAAWALLLAAALVAPWRALALSPPGDGGGERSFGFHRPERSGKRRFEWTEGRAARLLPWEGRVLILGLVNGHPRPDRHRVEVVVRVDGRELLRTEPSGRWIRHRLDLGAPQRDRVLLEIEARPTFRPFSAYRGLPGIARSSDVRRLGVAVERPKWRLQRHHAKVSPTDPGSR